MIQRKIKTDRRKSASSVKHEIMQEIGITISSQTVRRRAHEAGLYGRVARKKPYVNKANQLKRPNYVKTYRAIRKCHFGNMFYGQMNQNTTSLDQTARL